jgi:polysaccharide biosynthesis protein PelE
MNNKLAFAGVSMEIGALSMLVQGRTDTPSLLAFFGIHIVASALLAPILCALLPSGMRLPRVVMLGFIALVNALVPLLAPLFVASIHIGKSLRKIRTEAPVGTVADPIYDVYRYQSQTKARGGRIRTKLSSNDVSSSERLSSLLGIQDVPARNSAELLRSLLADPLDDIRLLAYGMIDAKEKAISQRILQEQAALESSAGNAPTADEQYGVHKRLSELHWELVYQRLVQGEMRKHACHEAGLHADAAIKLHADDAGLWFLRARIASELDEVADGVKALDMAQKYGFPRETAVPYLADFAYRGRRFAEVIGLYAELVQPPGTMSRAASYSFWTGRRS